MKKIFEFTFQKDNMKTLGSDYLKWSNKLNDLESLMKTMVSQINEKRLALDHFHLDGQRRTKVNFSDI